MLIQNVSSTAQATQPARLSGDGGPRVVSVETRQGNPAPEAAKHPSSAQLQSAVQTVNKALQQSVRNLEFSIDSDSKRTIVKLVDSETGDVIRQIPSEEMLAISRSIDQFQQGMLLKQKA
ncbi:MAG: flagellar protein FlaG [Nitrosomonadales bacterium]|nr:flagellar protein FlaG [Nitrosomonadales bacterium]